MGEVKKKRNDMDKIELTNFGITIPPITGNVICGATCAMGSSVGITTPDFTYKREPERSLRQKVMQIKNNIDVLCNIIELADKIERELE